MTRLNDIANSLSNTSVIRGQYLGILECLRLNYHLLGHGAIITNSRLQV
jgi:hypothetical protein